MIKERKKRFEKLDLTSRAQVLLQIWIIQRSNEQLTVPNNSLNVPESNTTQLGDNSTYDRHAVLAENIKVICLFHNLLLKDKLYASQLKIVGMYPIEN